MSRTSTKPASKSNVVSIAPPKATKPRAISLELVIRLAPDQHTVENLTRTFGLDPVDFDGQSYNAISDSGVAHRLTQDCVPRSRRATLCA